MNKDFMMDVMMIVRAVFEIGMFGLGMWTLMGILPFIAWLPITTAYIVFLYFTEKEMNTNYQIVELRPKASDEEDQ